MNSRVKSFFIVFILSGILGVFVWPGRPGDSRVLAKTEGPSSNEFLTTPNAQSSIASPAAVEVNEAISDENTVATTEDNDATTPDTPGQLTAAASVFPRFPPPSLPAKTEALTLDGCYTLALKQSETVAINAELIKEAEAHFLQSLGTLLPQTSFVWNQTNQDSGRAFGSANNNGTFESKFVFKQTLFSGFKEFAGMAGSRLEKEQYVQQRRRAEQLLFVDVSDAFYLLLEKREDLKTLNGIRHAFMDWVAALKKREEIGRSRHSEVVNTETQLYNIEAEIELVKSQEMVARDLLAFLIGQPVGELADTEDTANTLTEEANYLAKADTRPDVMSAQYAWGVAKKQVTVAKSDLFPTISLEGNYYKHRNAAPLDETWSTLLKVDVPIFEGTTTFGAIKGANAAARVSALGFQKTRRLAVQDIHDSYARAQASILRTAALNKAFQSAELNYSLQSQDYQFNLVSNLEVLAAIQNLGTTRRNYIQSFYEKKRYYWQLQAASGEIETEKTR